MQFLMFVKACRIWGFQVGSVLSTLEILQLLELHNASFTSVRLSSPLISAVLREKQNSGSQSRMLTLPQWMARSGFARDKERATTVY